MIFKDAREFLDEAVGSVLAQSFADLELLLVDDGGSDGSDVLARRQAAVDARARVLTHAGRRNRGTGPSRLLGIEAAQAPMIAFLDADDRWDPGHLEHEVGLLEAHPEAGMVCGRVRTWWSWTTPGAIDELTPLPFPPGSVVTPPRMLAAVLRYGGFAVSTGSLLARTAELRGRAGDLERFPSTYEDQVINTVLQLRCASVTSRSAGTWYRQHPTSLSVRAVQSGYSRASGTSASRVEFLDWVDGLPELARGRADPVVRALLDELMHEQASSRARTAGRVRWAAGRLPPPVRATARTALTALRRATDALGALHPAGTGAGPRATGALSAADDVLLRRFLHQWGEDLTGRVTEVGVLGLSQAARPTVEVERVEDLEGLAPAAHDCLVAPCVLAQVPDPVAALLVLRRALRPGGRLLVGLPVLRRPGDDPAGPPHVWTAPAAQALFAHGFDPDLTTVQTHAAAGLVRSARAGSGPARRGWAGHRRSAPAELLTVRAVLPV
jgi:SAM-dependent methyltransferase